MFTLIVAWAARPGKAEPEMLILSMMFDLGLVALAVIAISGT